MAASLMLLAPFVVSFVLMVLILSSALTKYT